MFNALHSSMVEGRAQSLDQAVINIVQPGQLALYELDMQLCALSRGGSL